MSCATSRTGKRCARRGYYEITVASERTYVGILDERGCGEAGVILTNIRSVRIFSTEDPLWQAYMCTSCTVRVRSITDGTMFRP